MKRVIVILAMIAVSGIAGCGTNTYGTAQKTARELTSVSDSDLCYAQKYWRSPQMTQEISRRNLNCGLQVAATEKRIGGGSVTASRHKQSVAAHFEDRGACPFECCTYRKWLAQKNISAHKDMNEQSPTAFRVRKGEWVDGVTGVVVTTKLGQARVTRPIALGRYRAKPGELVEVLNYAGEGIYKLRFRRTVIQPGDYDDSGISVVKEPETIWWVQLRNKIGQLGWSKEARSFGNQDACG